MPRVLRTAAANEDFFDIGVYIARDSLINAIRMLERIEQQARLLSEFPGMGQAREDLAPSLRSWPVGNYVMFYRPIEDGIEIVRVLHGARDAYNIFRRRGP